MLTQTIELANPLVDGPLAIAWFEVKLFQVVPALFHLYSGWLRMGHSAYRKYGEAVMLRRT